ncbi:uncharacterized protein LOC128231322 [Mya arenaria]|uniref:uncharacterized protein LOC128231322 n=1 Tax=Mya arenaria TaxID=6604 RepID=UPI0022E3DF12|nr:uncharacterized protein LOC128231322 [Mya arenaria]
MGASSSGDTKELEKFAEYHDLALVSYYATAPELSDTEMFPNLMRTIPPDGPLTKTITDFLGQLNWEYVAVVYTDNSYGRGAYNAIRPHLAKAGICLTAALGADPLDDSDATIDDVLRKLMQTNTTGVIYLGNGLLIDALFKRGALYEGAGKLQWVVTDSVSLSDKFPGQTYPRGLISVVPSSRTIIEFEDHWVRIDHTTSSTENPWFQDQYMAQYKCRIPGRNSVYTTDCPILTEIQRRTDFVQDQFVEPAVHAVFTYARALKQAHSDLCGVRGMCDALLQLSAGDFHLNYMRQMDFIYGKKERVESLASYSLVPYNAPARVKYEGNDITNPAFEVFNFNDYPSGTSYKFTSIGTYINQLLEIVNTRLRFYDEPRTMVLPYIPTSQCPSQPCNPCLGAIIDPKYVYIPGDVVITSAFSVHARGPQPLSCGDFLGSIMDMGIQSMEAFIYAIHLVNTEVAPGRGWLKGVKLGGLGFDDCQNAILSNQLITDVHHYSRAIRDENGQNLLDPRKVEAFLGPWMSWDMSELMKTLKRPVIGVQTLSTEFNDFEKYPYFVRATHDIEYIARTFINVVKRNGWKYIQAVIHSGPNGEESGRILKKVAAEEGICVVATHEINGMSDNGAEVVELLRRRMDVQPVAVFLESNGFHVLAKGLKETDSRGEFQFITSTGNSLRLVKGYEEYLTGLISFELWNGPSMTGLVDSLKTVDVQTYTTNPWMREWYENFYDCSFNPIPGQTVCGAQNMFADANFELNSDIIAVVYGVIATAQGLHETLKHYCGDNYEGVCGNFMNARDKGESLVQNIITKTRYVVNTGAANNVYDFNSQRMGNIPYKYFNFQRATALNSYYYTEVGEYRPREDSLYLENLILINSLPSGQIRSSCPGICMECLYLFGYQKFMYVDGDIIIPGIFDVHYRGDSPYSCDDIRVENGFQYTEAFRFALDRINSGMADVKLNGVKLGGLGFDGCTDHIRASAIVTGMYSGAYPIPNTDLASTEVTTEDLMAWLSYDSKTTVNVATILQRHGIPAVSPGATSPLLDNKKMFNTFFRTIPSASVVAEAIAKLSNLLGFKYVVTVNAPEDGNREAVRVFRELAKTEGICIGASYEFKTDGSEAQIFRYLTESTTRVVVVFASPDEYIEGLLREKDRVGNTDIIFITSQPWTTPAKKIKPSGDSPIISTISFNMDGNIDLNDFLLFLESESLSLMDHPNPWFREYFESVMQCNLAGTYKYTRQCQASNVVPLDTDRIRQDMSVLPTINAVYAIAEGIHRTLQTKCGVNYTGVCSEFISDETVFDQIMANMDILSFRDIMDMMFRFVEREADRSLTFYQVQSNGNENRVGTYTGQLNIPLEETLKGQYENVQATCVGECSQCKDDSSGIEKFMFIAGEVTIAALFDVHKMGNTPYTCGEINDMHGFQLMEAFNWAMNYVNTKQGMFSNRLRGIKLGSLVFDTCSSAVRAGNLVANYHARNFEIETTEYRIDPSLIDLYIGPMTSESTVRVADVLKELGIPQIGYGASTLELTNQRKYGYFIRTVPADDKQARTLISLLKKYELENVQLISQNSSNGEYAREEFLRLAPINKICVSAQFVIGQAGKVDANEALDVLKKLNDKPQAKAVVVIMDDPSTMLLEANNLNQIIDGGFFFITTDQMGFGMRGYENLEGIDRLVSNRRLITLEVESADYPEVDAYLEDKTPANYMANPWFREYFEYIHNCSFGDPTLASPLACNQYTMGYPRAEKFIQDPYALYVINAVFSAALGIEQTVIDMCGVTYTGICNILLDHGERREMFLSNIKKVRFEDRTKQPFYYTPAGSSDRGYHIYEPQNFGLSLHAGAQSYYWEDIGSYNDTHFLKMDVEYDPPMSSSCSTGYCECVFPEYQPSRYMKKPSPNDLNIVFVSDIHKANGMGCGEIDTGSNMQNLLAFLFAIERVNANQNSKFQASLKLGGVALDTCSQPSRIGQDVYSLLSGEPICGEKDGVQVIPASSAVAYMVRNSGNSVALSSMLSPLKITSLSMSATSVELNDKLEHPYFLRTVPPDNVQAIVVSQILKTFSWDYITVVYADNTYGRSARDTLLDQAESSNPQYCFSRTISMPLDADLETAKNVIDRLNSRIGARVVVTFVTSEQVQLLLQATTEKGLNHRFIWIGSDSWANSYEITNKYEETAAGAITIQIRSEFSQSFRNFVKSVTFTDRKGIPTDWFEEFYQTMHQCRILGSVIQKTYTRICTGNELFTDDMFTQDPYVLHTIISVYQIANGLNQIEECSQSSSLNIASCLALLKDRKQTIYDSILNAQHDVLPDDLKDRSFNFKFTGEGYGDIGYNIYNFRRNLTSGQYEYIKIGSFSGDLRLDPRDYQSYSFTDRSLPSSRCQIGTTCSCEGLDNTIYSFSRQDRGYEVTDEGQYEDPITGLLVTIEDTPESADRFRDIWAIIVATLAAIGAFAALCMFIYLLVVYPVRGGTTILGYMLSFGIILMYGLVFAFIIHASEELCGLRRFALGFVYSIVYSALFVKLVDCWRTKDKEDIYMVKYNKIGNPWGLFFSACLIVLVQVMVNAEWLILEAPGMERVIYNNMLWPRCSPDDFYDEGLILSNVFNMFLMFLCIIVGLFAFGNDKNHWDCRWLTGCVVLTIPSWMVWCLVASLGEYKMRDAAVAIGLLFNATVMLMCGPMRKLWLLNRYQAQVEAEERKSQFASSQRDYNSIYGTQYDNVPQMHDNGSVRGSTVGVDDVFMYEPKS